MRSREMSGERCLGLVKKAIAVKSAVVVKTFRLPLTSAPPKFVSKKYFCASSQLTSSRAGGPTGQLLVFDGWVSGCSQGSDIVCAGLGWFGGGKPVGLQFSIAEGLRLSKRRVTTPYSTSLVSLRMSRSSKRRILEKLSTPITRR